MEVIQNLELHNLGVRAGPFWFVWVKLYFLSVLTIFKDFFFQCDLINQSQILYRPFLGRKYESLYKCSRSYKQDNNHTHIRQNKKPFKVFFSRIKILSSWNLGFRIGNKLYKVYINDDLCIKLNLDLSEALRTLYKWWLSVALACFILRPNLSCQMSNYRTTGPLV